VRAQDGAGQQALSVQAKKWVNNSTVAICRTQPNTEYGQKNARGEVEKKKKKRCLLGGRARWSLATGKGFQSITLVRGAGVNKEGNKGGRGVENKKQLNGDVGSMNTIRQAG